MAEKTQKQIKQERRESLMISEARRKGENISYIDDDGCEVTITTAGHVFYNAADWY